MAQLVYSDPLALSVPNEAHSVGEELWITLGQAGSRVAVVVVLTYRDTEEEEVIRLISARKATPKESKLYMNLPEAQDENGIRFQRRGTGEVLP